MRDLFPGVSGKRFLTLLLGLVLCGCATVNAPVTGRQQHMLVSEEEVIQMSYREYSKILRQAAKSNKLDVDQEQFNRVSAITKRLVPEAAKYRRESSRWKWEAHVLQTKSLNAWCMAGGKMMIYSGLIERTSATDDEVAAVMAHEIGHALAQHSREAISRQLGQDLVLSAVSAAAGLGNSGADLARVTADVLFQLPHSREQELEADRIGLVLMSNAGYNPHAMLGMFRKMSALNDNGGPEFLSTHPSDETRIRAIEDALQQMPAQPQRRHPAQ